MYLADNIRYMRKKMNMSQEDLANRLGYKSYTTIQKWESGVSEPPLKKLKELADIFEVDMDWLTSRKFMDEEEFFFRFVKDYADKYPARVRDNLLGLTEQEMRVLEYYRQLNKLGKEKASEYLSDLTETKKYTEG